MRPSHFRPACPGPIIFSAGPREAYHSEQLTQTPNTPSWGAGEPTIEVIAPAIANAIYNAMGKRLTVLPITSQRVLTALQTS
jgi:CO/xanthine dehydrogenase Mo-binding subunit